MTTTAAAETPADSAPPLAGRRALVTGGSRGIGAEIVRRLAAEGAAVAFTYHSSPEQAEALAATLTAAGGTVVAIRADSGDADAIGAAVDDAAGRLGGLDTLVNNAGVAHIADVDTYPLDEFDRMLAINVRGVFAAIQRALPHLGAGGRVITIGSVNADRVPVAGLAAYAMTKAAVAGLTRGLARELGPRGITVNNIQPGPVNTDMNPEAGEFADVMRGLTAVGRYGQPRDIADAVAYLARPETGYITGVNWNVDGGYTL
ncbi:MAG: 3-oxoacyl-ACP reductase FabG [Actinobacteria bacterium]|nr:3-oxoacyl-ACP reductase FabG [Actinomycetota bacterium]